MPTTTLFEALGALSDPRSRRGRIHSLQPVLGLVALGLLMGRTSLRAIARLGRQYGTSLGHALGFRRGKTPAVSTLSRTLRRLDAPALEAILSRWLEGRLQTATFQHISIDGKTLRGSRDGEIPGQHLVAAFAPEVQAVLAQVRMEATTNEHKAALQLLGILPVKDKVVVADAIFCQRDIAEEVVKAGGDYILMVKDNQSGLRIDIDASFAFATAARSIAAATSPYTAANHTATGSRGDNAR